MEQQIFLYDHQKSETWDFATLKKSFSSKHEVLSEYSNSILGVIFPRSQLFSLFLEYNLIGVSCVHDFSYWDKDLGQTDLPDTPNMFLKSAENILDAFEKKSFSSKHDVFSEHPNFYFELSSSVFQLTLLFKDIQNIFSGLEEHFGVSDRFVIPRSLSQ